MSASPESLSKTRRYVGLVGEGAADIERKLYSFEPFEPFCSNGERFGQNG
jgi:hypothetical protein